MASYVIGIDPDCDLSGFTWLNVKTGEVKVESLSFPKLIEEIANGLGSLSDTVIVVEAGWLNKGNWHIRKGDSVMVAGAKGNRTGRNQETGRKIVEMCRYYGRNVVEIKPLKKCWKGKDKKITQAEISQFVPNFPKRSNQEERDSCLIAWYYAGLKIKVKL